MKKELNARKKNGGWRRASTPSARGSVASAPPRSEAIHPEATPRLPRGAFSDDTLLKSPVDASSGALTLQPLQVASIWPAMARWASAWTGLLVDGPHYHVSSPRRRRVAHAKESTLLEGGSKQGQAPPADFVVGQKSGPLRSGVWLA